MNQETKVGLFLLMAMGVVLPSILFIGNIKIFRRTSPFYIDFVDVEALPPKAAVKAESHPPENRQASSSFLSTASDIIRSIPGPRKGGGGRSSAPTASLSLHIL